MVEQLMRTGGGWQDQLGGIVPGCKVLRTTPGFDQSPSVEPITLAADTRAELDSRMILYYTGLQRRAANILQKVVGRYLARDPESIRIVGDLKAGAERMAGELAGGDIDAFSRTLLEYWSLKRSFDPGSTTESIEALFDEVRDDLAGYELPGAGGGGFLLLVAKDAGAASRVRAKLEALKTNRTARLYDAVIDDRGLRVTVV
jgi:fucokinase